METPLISAHIEKTAGTTLQRLFEDTYGADRVYLFTQLRRFHLANQVGIRRTSPIVDGLKEQLAGSKVLSWIHQVNNALNKTRCLEGYAAEEILRDEVDVIHGHFKADVFDAIFDKPRVVMVTRDPLERAISQYQHWKRTLGGSDINWQVRTPFDPELGFEDYIDRPEQENLQTQVLGTRAPDEIDYLGAFENLDSLVKRLGLKQQGKVTPHLNKRPPHEPQITVSESFKAYFKTRHKKDYALHALSMNA